ncbi:MAG TPA: DUF6438 domain-containing protein [Rhizomicrobium sp.]
MRLSIVGSLLLFAPPMLAQGGFPTAATNITMPQGDHEIVLPLRSGGFGERHAFPPIRDWKSLRIEFVRTPCYGSCPAYSVVVSGDGTVRYQGDYCVIAKGARVAHLPQKDVRALFEAFQRADFFSLRPIYDTGITDNSGVTMVLHFDQWNWSVDDRQETTGLPVEASKLPDLIDKFAGTARWVAFPDKDCRRQ